jgi:hypothetical protein
VTGLEAALAVRAVALERFGRRNLAPDRALGELARVLVPLYFHHRYMVTAAAKLVGGVDYDHALAGDPNAFVRLVDGERQRAALRALASTLAPEVLDLPERVLRDLAPLPPGFGASREDLEGATGSTFDPLGAAASLARLTIAELVEPSRLKRVHDQHRRDAALPSLDEVLRVLGAAALAPADGTEAARLAELRRVVLRVFVDELIRVSLDPQAAGPVRDALEGTLEAIANAHAGQVTSAALVRDIRRHLARTSPPAAPQPAAPPAPPGPPIGAGSSGALGSTDGPGRLHLAGPPHSAHLGTHAAELLGGWGDCPCGLTHERR